MYTCRLNIILKLIADVVTKTKICYDDEPITFITSLTLRVFYEKNHYLYDGYASWRHATSNGL